MNTTPSAPPVSAPESSAVDSVQRRRLIWPWGGGVGFALLGAATARHWSEQDPSQSVASPDAFLLLVGWILFGGSLWHYRRLERSAAAMSAARQNLQRSCEQLEARVREQTATLADLGRQLAASTRNAIQAEAAATALHGVNGALRNIQISTSLLLEKVRESRLAEFPATVARLKAHSSNLGAYLTNDVQGRELPRFLESLSEQWMTERAELQAEVHLLSQHIDHLREIVQRHQAATAPADIAESVSVADALQEAADRTRDAIQARGIQFQSDVAADLAVTGDRAVLVQLLSTLLRHAADALGDQAPAPSKIIFRGAATGEGFVRLEIVNHGPGTPAGALTVRPTSGTGLPILGKAPGPGLAECTAAVQLLGGSLQSHSDGPSRGSVVTLDLPAPSQSDARHAA